MSSFFCLFNLIVLFISITSPMKSPDFFSSPKKLNEPKWTQRNTINPITFLAKNFASLALFFSVSLRTQRTAMGAKNTNAFLHLFETFYIFIDHEKHEEQKVTRQKQEVYILTFYFLLLTFKFLT